MLVLFIAALCVGVGAWFYAMQYFMPMWLAGFRHREENRGDPRKTLIGTAVFIGALRLVLRLEG